MKSTRARTPTKNSKQSQNANQIYQNCLKILMDESQEETSKWLIDHKLSGVATRNQRSVSIINLAFHVFTLMIVEGEGSEVFLPRVISYFKNSSQKAYEFCRFLNFLQQKDCEFDFISSVARCENMEPISFYLKVRKEVIDSFLNKNKKELMVSILANEQEWFKVVKKIFKNFREEEMIELFTDTIKYHYLSIKKNQNEQLNGAEILRICQIIYKTIKGSQNERGYSIQQTLQYQPAKTNYFGQQEQPIVYQKEKEVRRLFKENIVNGLEAQDRELIRILSYKDNNIARLLQKKHEKMIEMIADDVEGMRQNIEAEKTKFVELWKQKQEILNFVDQMNLQSLNYISVNSAENEEKVMKSIEEFSSKWKMSSEVAMKTRKLRENRQNKRLIEIIERQEKQRC